LNQFLESTQEANQTHRLPKQMGCKHEESDNQ